MDYCGVEVTLNDGLVWNQDSPLPADLDLKTRPGIITRSVSSAFTSCLFLVWSSSWFSLQRKCCESVLIVVLLNTEQEIHGWNTRSESSWLLCKAFGTRVCCVCSPFIAWSRSVYSHTCYAYCQGFLPCLFLLSQSIHLHFFQNLSWFLLCWLWLTHGSCVGPQNKIGHPAGCRFPCWVPAEYK